MDRPTSLEARVASLERSLRRSRQTGAALGLSTLVVAAGAFVQQPSSALESQLEERLARRLQTALAAQAQEQLTTQRLVLTDGAGVDRVVLGAGDDGSLLVLTPAGDEILRLGGSAARRIGH